MLFSKHLFKVWHLLPFSLWFFISYRFNTLASHSLFKFIFLSCPFLVLFSVFDSKYCGWCLCTLIRQKAKAKSSFWLKQSRKEPKRIKKRSDVKVCKLFYPGTNCSILMTFSNSTIFIFYLYQLYHTATIIT